MRRYLLVLCYAVILISIFLIPTSAHAATVSAKKPSSTVYKGDAVTIPLTIDTGADAVSGTDVYIKYDSSALHYEGVKDTHYFSYVNAVEDGSDMIHVSAVVGDVKNLKKGTGSFATVLFTSLKSGTSDIEIVCAPGAKNSSKIIRGDLDATDVIHCEGIKPVAVSVTDTSFFGKAYSFLFGWLK